MSAQVDFWVLNSELRRDGTPGLTSGLSYQSRHLTATTTIGDRSPPLTMLAYGVLYFCGLPTGAV